MSFILKSVRRDLGIEIRHDVLRVESQNPLIILASFLLERICGLECKNGNYIGWVTISIAMIQGIDTYH